MESREAEAKRRVDYALQLEQAKDLRGAQREFLYAADLLNRELQALDAAGSYGGSNREQLQVLFRWLLKHCQDIGEMLKATSGTPQYLPGNAAYTAYAPANNNTAGYNAASTPTYYAPAGASPTPSPAAPAAGAGGYSAYARPSPAGVTAAPRGADGGAAVPAYAAAPAPAQYQPNAAGQYAVYTLPTPGYQPNAQPNAGVAYKPAAAPSPNPAPYGAAQYAAPSPGGYHTPAGAAGGGAAAVGAVAVQRMSGGPPQYYQPAAAGGGWPAYQPQPPNGPYGYAASPAPQYTAQYPANPAPPPAAYAAPNAPGPAYPNANNAAQYAATPTPSAAAAYPNPNTPATPYAAAPNATTYPANPTPAAYAAPPNTAATTRANPNARAAPTAAATPVPPLARQGTIGASGVSGVDSGTTGPSPRKGSVIKQPTPFQQLGVGMTPQPAAKPAAAGDGGAPPPQPVAAATPPAVAPVLPPQPAAAALPATPAPSPAPKPQPGLAPGMAVPARPAGAKPLPTPPQAVANEDPNGRKLPQPLQRDINLFSLEGYAEEYFATVKKGLFRRKVPAGDLVSWQKDGLSSSLLRLSPKKSKMAVECFKNLQIYMGDRGTNAANESAADTAAANFINKGVEVPELRDELYIQLCKQTTQNPSPASTIRGWELIAMCYETFLPSKDFEAQMWAYVQEHAAADSGADGDSPERIRHFAQRCMKRIEFAARHGSPALRVYTKDDIRRLRELVGTTTIGVFGVPLEELPPKNGGPPQILSVFLQVLRELGAPSTTGMFRVAAESALVQTLRQQLDAAGINAAPEKQAQLLSAHASAEAQVHAVGSALKLWLKMLPVPVFTPAVYSTVIQNPEDPQVPDKVIAQLPPHHRAVLVHLVSFLREVMSPTNLPMTKMTAENLSVVFSPVLLRCPVDDPLLLLQNTKLETAFVKNVLLNWHIDSH